MACAPHRCAQCQLDLDRCHTCYVQDHGAGGVDREMSGSQSGQARARLAARASLCTASRARTCSPSSSRNRSSSISPATSGSLTRTRPTPMNNRNGTPSTTSPGMAREPGPQRARRPPGRAGRGLGRQRPAHNRLEDVDHSAEVLQRDAASVSLLREWPVRAGRSPKAGRREAPVRPSLKFGRAPSRYRRAVER